MAERDAKKVAEGLTRPQRQAVLETDRARDYAEVNGHVRLALFRKDIFAAVAGPRLNLYLTPLGLAVRDHLRGEQ